MKKKFFFILLIILIIIIFSYNYCYEHFSVKVQDAMIFKDYQDKLVGTYPDKNIYPDFFIKSNGEYVNMIGTVHGVSEIKISKPKDGKKGPIGDQGNQGDRGPQGPRGKHGLELVTKDIENNSNSTCIAPGGISISRMCKGPDGDSPSAPPDGTPGQRCPHQGGKCPDGVNGVPGQTCKQKYGIDAGQCPRQESKRGLPGLTCEKVNRDAGIVVGEDYYGVKRKCPAGADGNPGKTCAQVHPDLDIGRDNICPVHKNGNPGQTCYQIFENTLPQCTKSTPGVNSVDCINPDTPNVKTCGVINPDKPSDVANNLSINGNTLTINNNKAISFGGNSIKLPTDGNIVLTDANNNIIKTINKSYIDTMILKSQQCKKCPDRNGKKWWNNSTNCQQEQGECKECKECESGEYIEQACSEHSNTQCKQCDPGYVGIGCEIKCDPIKGEYPNSSKSGCDTITSDKYITDDYIIHNVPDGYYRNPNDATIILRCPKGNYCKGGIKNSCPSGQFQLNVGQDKCNNCTSNCGDGNYRDGSCTNISNYSCHSCPSDYYCNGINKYQCSNCGSGKKMVGGCTGNQDTQCSPCTSRTSHKKSAHQQGINWDTSCPHNCKVQIWDNTFRGNDWDVYGKADNGWWIRGSKASGDVYWEGSYNGGGITVSGNELYFWQYTPGNNKWKFNVINNHKSYKSGNNKQRYCNTCSGHNRSLGGSCTSDFNTYGRDRLWQGL
tara:strand:+ start:7098 stop:9260 length:2163 start_codon:yes stop_codon:yes gene_type:complete